MKLLLVVLFITYVSAVPVEECSWGESYWCSSLKAAKSCGAVTHCIDTVWKTTTIKDKEDVCQFCENLVGDVRNFITDNQTQAMITKYLDSACGLIPVSQLADQCKDTVDNDLQEFFQMLKSELDPAQVCAAIGLCAGFEDLAKHPKVHPNSIPVLLRGAPVLSASNVVPQIPKAAPIKYKATGDVCTDCKAFFGDIKDMVTSNATEAQIEQMLKEELCTQLGALKDECDGLVDTYVPEIMDILANEMDPATTCGAMGFCNGGDKTLLAKLKLQKTLLYKKAIMSKAGEECTVCKVIMGELQDLDRSSSVQADVENFLKSNLCAKLGDLKDACDATVDEYGSILFELLANELDPDTRCKSLGFCSSAVVDNAATKVSEIIRQSAPVQKELKKLGQSVECVLCEYIMSEVDNLLKENSSKAQIEAALEKVCSLLPDTIKEECSNFVEEYGPAVIELLEQELSPDVVCSTLGLCSNSKVAAKPINVKVGNDELCTVCEIAVNYVDALLKDNATQQEIEQAMDKVCNYLPDTLKGECTQFVAQYGPEVIQLISSLTPTEVCVAIHVCDNAGLNELKKAVEAVPFVPIKPQKASLVGVKKCTYGPSYWCASPENAKECNAESHCLKHVWNK